LVAVTAALSFFFILYLLNRLDDINKAGKGKVSFRTFTNPLALSFYILFRLHPK
jgi:hypothetical protein